MAPEALPGPASLTVRPARGFTPPTVPLNWTCAPALVVVTFRVQGPAPLPLTVPAEVRVALAPSATASLYAWPPVVMTLPPLRAVPPPLSVVNDARAAVPPTGPANVWVVLPFTVRLAPPAARALTVDPKVRLAAVA